MSEMYLLDLICPLNCFGLGEARFGMHAILGHFSFKQLDLAKRFIVGNAGGSNVHLILVEF